MAEALLFFIVASAFTYGVLFAVSRFVEFEYLPFFHVAVSVYFVLMVVWISLYLRHISRTAKAWSEAAKTKRDERSSEKE